MLALIDPQEGFAVWDVVQRRQIVEFDSKRVFGKATPGAGTVLAAAVSPDNGRIATCSNIDRIARLWDIATLREIALDCKQPMRAVRFSPDGRWLATAGSELPSRIMLWDARTGDPQWCATSTVNHVFDIAFSPDSTRLVVAGGNVRAGDIRILHVPTGRQLFALRGNGGRVLTASFATTGQRLVTGSDDKLLRVWDGN